MQVSLEQVVKGVEVFPVAVVITDSNGKIVLVNSRTEEMFGYRRDELLGQTVEILMPQRYREIHTQHRSDYNFAPRTRLMGLGLDLVGRRKNSEEFPIEVGLSPAETDSGTIIISMVHDITKRKEAEEALSTVSLKLIEAHEEERTRIARELHDDISQRLALLMLNLDRLRTDAQTSPAEFREAIVKAREGALNLVHDIQALSHRLHSSKLEYFGLAKAAAIYCSELSDLHNVEIDLRSEDIPGDLSKEIALCMFRVLQEALQNAIKHSQAQRFDVSFSRTLSGMICLTVHDSGIGFDPGESIKGRGLGLISMKERLNLVGGELSIESQPGKGTTIHARVPLSPTKKAGRAG
jgi:PAS domain S-box-containing protein